MSINITIPDGTPSGNYGIVSLAAPNPAPKGDVGIDLSAYNDVKDFLAVKNAGKKVVIHRATKGATGVDSQYRTRWPEIVQTKFDFFGIYHLFIPGVKGSQQYDNLMNVTHGDFGNYPITVDVEPIPDGQVYGDPINDVVNPLREFLSLIKAQYRPIIYTRASATPIMGLNKQLWLLDYPLHTANYTQGGTVLVADPWLTAGSGAFCWQHWNKGVVPGILGNVDLDTFYGLPFIAG